MAGFLCPSRSPPLCDLPLLASLGTSYPFPTSPVRPQIPGVLSPLLSATLSIMPPNSSSKHSSPFLRFPLLHQPPHLAQLEFLEHTPLGGMSHAFTTFTANVCMLLSSFNNSSHSHLILPQKAIIIPTRGPKHEIRTWGSALADPHRPGQPSQPLLALAVRASSRTSSRWSF